MLVQLTFAARNRGESFFEDGILPSSSFRCYLPVYAVRCVERVGEE